MNDEKSIVDLVRESQAGGGQPAPQQQPSLDADAGAVERKAQMMSENIPVDKNVEEALEALLANVKTKMAWMEVELPSNGLLYPDGKKTIQIRPFTFEDEKILRTVRNANQVADIIKVLLNRAVKNLDYDKLTLADKTFLIFKLREISYGNDYAIDLECPKCTAKNSLNVELSRLPVKYLDRDSLEATKVTLPDSEVEVEFRYPMADDDANMTDVGAIMDGLWKFVKSVGGHDSRMIIQQFISKTTGKDVLTLQNKIFGTDYGLQTKVNFICNSCGADSALELPLNESFFSVS